MRIQLVALCVLVLAATRASAHLDLSSPPSRYGRDALKIGPCGMYQGSRSENVSRFESGATIDVVWDEYVDHPGHFRIAFDADGDDDFVDPACSSGCNTRSPQIELYSNGTVLLDGIDDTRGGEGRVTVRLPDVECERCTLQVIQVMYDKPPYEIPGNDIYYQCADLVLRRAAGPTPSPTPVCAGQDDDCIACPGDCDGSGAVEVNELVTLVRIALGDGAVSECRPGDAHRNDVITVDEVVAAVQRSLSGCASP